MDIWQFLGALLDIADRLLTIIILVAVLLWFAFQRWISEFIRSRFSRAVGSQLEDQKHLLNKELEAYKGALLRQLEEFRADIDIKRSMALKLADARLDALRDVANAIDFLVNEGMAMCVASPAGRAHNADEYHAACAGVRIAIRRAGIFLPLPLAREIATLSSDVVSLAGDCMLNDTVLQRDDVRINQILGRAGNIAEQMRVVILADASLPKGNA